MAWRTLRYKLTSSAPLIMHNGQTADPLNKWSKSIKEISSKRAKTEADHQELARLEFMAALYLDENGPVIPAYVIEGALVAAAKKTKEGTLAKSGCYCLEHARLDYEGPRQAAELWNDERFRLSAIVRVQTDRVRRTRPIFQNWSALVSISVEDTLVNPARVDEWINTAGSQIGLCDWRPQHGRFTVEKMNGH